MPSLSWPPASRPPPPPQDSFIGKRVIHIGGAISSTNTITMPKKSGAMSGGLGLTGRFLYLEVRCSGFGHHRTKLAQRTFSLMHLQDETRGYLKVNYAM